MSLYCRHDKKPEDDNAKVNDHSVPPSAAVPSAEPAKPEEPAKQDKQPPPPEKILQIDDPKAVHIDGERRRGGEGGRG